MMAIEERGMTQMEWLSCHLLADEIGDRMEWESIWTWTAR